MKTENSKTAAAASTPGPEAAHAALIAVLNQFNFTIGEFARKPTRCYEQMIAGRSPDDLKRLYFILLQPGKLIKDMRKECLPFPAGRFAGRLPDICLLGRIQRRLIKAAADDHSISQLERKRFHEREEIFLLKTKQLSLDREKFEKQLATATPPQPVLPVSQETPTEMIERVYGYNPFKK